MNDDDEEEDRTSIDAPPPPSDPTKGVCGRDRFSSSSIQDVIVTIVKKNGYGGLMRGWVPRILIHAPAAAICWSTYEAAKSFFQDLNGRNNSLRRNL